MLRAYFPQQSIIIHRKVLLDLDVDRDSVVLLDSYGVFGAPCLDTLECGLGSYHREALDDCVNVGDLSSSLHNVVLGSVDDIVGSVGVVKPNDSRFASSYQSWGKGEGCCEELDGTHDV